MAIQALPVHRSRTLFTCSGAIHADAFREVVAEAARETGRRAVIEYALGQSSDHPVALDFPEGAYLKGLACRVHETARGPAVAAPAKRRRRQ